MFPFSLDMKTELLCESVAEQGRMAAKDRRERMP
jgi:hypothetical protein